MKKLYKELLEIICQKKMVNNVTHSKYFILSESPLYVGNIFFHIMKLLTDNPNLERLQLNYGYFRDYIWSFLNNFRKKDIVHSTLLNY
jgi:hypothetical protein